VRGVNVEVVCFKLSLLLHKPAQIGRSRRPNDSQWAMFVPIAQCSGELRAMIGAMDKNPLQTSSFAVKFKRQTIH
jgi:hypothetical protein